MDIQDPEFQALLSAYAMGTLTASERTRLFEMALNNQALFDSLMEEQTLKDALDHPLVRKSLLRAIEKVREEQPYFAAASPMAPIGKPPTPARPRLIWAAAASAAALGVVLVMLVLRAPELPTKEEPVRISLKTGPASPAPPAAPAADPPSTPKRAKSEAVSAQPGIDIPKSTAAADIEAKQERTAPAVANSFNAPSAEALESPARRATAAPLSAAPFSAAPLSAAQVLRENGQLFLRVSAPSSGFLYAFAEDGSGWLPISAPGANIWRAGEQKSFPLGPLASGTEIRLLFTSARDEELELALENPRLIPQRQWTSLRVPR